MEARDDQLHGQVALVTGGGSGLGRAICAALAEAGATVVAADLRREAAQATSREIDGHTGRCIPMELDVRDERQASAAIERLVDQQGRLDVLVNNAGTDITCPLEELTVDQWDCIVATNLRGPFLLAREAFPIMRRHGSGQVVNIVSTAAKRAWPNASAYHASKWGLLGLSHALHAEGRAANIKVSAVVCGGMRTPFLLDRFPDLDVGKLQDPRNVARTVLFLLTLPSETVIPEMLVLPMHETSWP